MARAGRQAPSERHGRIKNIPPAGGALRPLQPGTCARLRVIHLATGEDRLILPSSIMLEAPNRAPDGKALYVIGQGGGGARLHLSEAPRLGQDQAYARWSGKAITPTN